MIYSTSHVTNWEDLFTLSRLMNCVVCDDDGATSFCYTEVISKNAVSITVWAKCSNGGRSMKYTPEMVWDDFSKPLKQFILKRITSPEDAEDILQEIFVKIQCKLEI